MKSPHDLAKGLALYLPTQRAIADALGVSQPNVSRWLSDPAAEMLGPVHLAASRLLSELEVRDRWILAFIIAEAGKISRVKDRIFEVPLAYRERLVLVDEGEFRLIDNQQIGIATEPDLLAETLRYFVRELVAETAALSFATSGDYFGFFAREGKDLRVFDYRVVSGSQPRTAFPIDTIDPIFGG